MRYRAKRHQYVAFLLLVLAGVVYFARSPAADIRSWKPLAVPIELKVGKVLTPELTAGLDTRYRLLLESARIESTRLHGFIACIGGARHSTITTERMSAW